MTDPKLEQAQAQAQGGGEVPWRAHGAAMDAKALATAQEIALMWGHDRSQFVSRIQVAVLDAMRWIAAAAPPSAPVGPIGLLDRIKAAEKRIEEGRAPRRPPADPRGDTRARVGAEERRA